MEEKIFVRNTNGPKNAERRLGAEGPFLGVSKGQSWNVFESCVYLRTLIHLMTRFS